MISKIKQSIIEHHKCLDRAVSLTKITLCLVKKEDNKNIYTTIENRDRLINIINYLQKKIENDLSKYYTEELKSNITKWQEETNIAIQSIISMDQEILEYLNQNKKKIKQEISTIHKSKIVHKKYHLSESKP